MGIQDLQRFIERGTIDGSCLGVDLVRIARIASNKWTKNAPHKKGPINGAGKYTVVVDAECCLDRLYGGFFSDWVCGGQWNRVITFLGQFVSSLNMSNIELVVFFNGCAEPSRTQEWIQGQLSYRNKIGQVLRHLSNKGTPPPKIWWTPPSCLRPTLRMVLRNLNIPVIVTMDDHKHELINYCRENNCHAIIADDAEYISFIPPRYFSARHLKLTYKGTLETKEYMVAELIKGLGLSPEQLCILSALLGNHLLPETELAELHSVITQSKDKGVGNDSTEKPDLIKAVANYVKGLKTNDLDKLGQEIFGVAGGDRANKFKEAAQYYLDGTKAYFLKYKPVNSAFKKSKKVLHRGGKEEAINHLLTTCQLASEAGGNELEGLISVSEAAACLSVGPGITVDEAKESGLSSPSLLQLNSNHNSLLINSSSSSEAASPSRQTATNLHKAKSQKTVRLVVDEDKIEGSLPHVAPEIIRTVSERHMKGLMSPMIYQILTQGEVKLPVVMEDEQHKEIFSIQLFFRPLRQMVYAILFNLHHLTYLAKNSKDKNSDSKFPEIKVKEWIWTLGNPYTRAEVVKAEPLGWGVPTIQRLWFGSTVDDKRRRLRAYLTCMHSDTPKMLNPTYVPQHLLILATVLRYMMSFPDKRVLRRHELDAIIATSLDPQLVNSEYNQDQQVECVSPRAVQLGAMVMTGVEYALLVNDACGAPIPWFMTWPWLYYDGKLLHSHLVRAANVKNLYELCNHKIPQVMRVEQMREAILDGLFVSWAGPSCLPPLTPAEVSRVHAIMPAGMSPPTQPRGGSRGGRGSSQPPVRGRDCDCIDIVNDEFKHISSKETKPCCDCLEDVGEGYKYVSLCNDCEPCISTGGRLEIAGVVVGNWGPNCRMHHQNMMISPQFQGQQTRRRSVGGGIMSQGLIKKDAVKKPLKGRGVGPSTPSYSPGLSDCSRVAESEIVPSFLDGHFEADQFADAPKGRLNRQTPWNYFSFTDSPLHPPTSSYFLH